MVETRAQKKEREEEGRESERLYRKYILFTENEKKWKNWTSAKERFEDMMLNIKMHVAMYRHGKTPEEESSEEKEILDWLLNVDPKRLRFFGHQKGGLKYVGMATTGEDGYYDNTMYKKSQWPDFHILMGLAYKFDLK